MFESRSPKVLMIAGAGFTGAMVCRFTRVLRSIAEYRVSALGLRAVGRAYDSDPATLFERHDPFPSPPNPRHRPWKATGAALGALSSRPPEHSERTFKRRIAENLLWREMRRELPPLLAGYDLFHWHCFLPEYLPALDLFPPNAKIVMSLWGSDLYRPAGLDGYIRQLTACSKVSLFTVGSLEMRETFLSKFGRQYIDQLRIVNYGADNLECIDQVREARHEFLTRVGLDPQKTIVCVGNSAGHGNRHLAILHEIGKMQRATLQRIALIFPMTYPRDDSYATEVEAAARSLRVPAKVLTEYMPDLDVARMWVACDILLHLPVSDQFSAAMSEALYADTVLITGAWLPYSRLRLNRIHYHEIEGVEGLAPALSSVIDNFPVEKAKAAKTAPAMREIIAWNSVMPKWVALYDELLAAAPVDKMIEPAAFNADAR